MVTYNHHYVFSSTVNQSLRFLRRWMRPGQTLHQIDRRNSFYNQYLFCDNRAIGSIEPSQSYLNPSLFIKSKSFGYHNGFLGMFPPLNEVQIFKLINWLITLISFKFVSGETPGKFYFQFNQLQDLRHTIFFKRYKILVRKGSTFWHLAANSCG